MMKCLKKTIKIPENLHPDVILWSIVLFLFVFTLNWEADKLKHDLHEIFFTFTPIIAVIYINYFLFKKYLLKKRILLFVVFSIIIYTVFYYIIDWIFTNIVPQRNDDIVFSIFIYSLMYIGFRYLITGPRQIIKLKNEENKRIKAERDLQEMMAKHSQAELDVLKSQVNPHFLFNSLNNIYSLTIVDPDKAGEAIIMLSDLMRYNLESSKKSYVTLQHEVDFINNYILLESLRVDDSCNISFNTKGNFSTRAIAPMLLISFVENCFKHGINPKVNDCFIDIDIKLEDNTLAFTTKNKIAPPRPDLEKKDVKIGIENVKRRLDLLYKDKYNLHIGSEDGIYTIDLKIEL